jgi:hypothetical protein
MLMAVRQRTPTPARLNWRTQRALTELPGNFYLLSFGMESDNILSSASGIWTQF